MAVGSHWSNGTDQMDFQYSLDATSLTTGTWIDVNALDFVAPVTAGTVGALDGNAAANRSAVSGVINGLNIAAGATIWIRWNDFNASGADDGLAIDDLSITRRSETLTVSSVSARHRTTWLRMEPMQRSLSIELAAPRALSLSATVRSQVELQSQARITRLSAVLSVGQMVRQVLRPSPFRSSTTHNWV